MLFSSRLLRTLTALALAPPLAAFAAAPITGVVTNQTTHKPAAGDTVTLIRLAQGMQEATHTTTDARGHYTLDVPDDGLHLVRVTHDGANYFQPAPAGTTSVDVDVYNAAAVVKGVATEAVVMRLQSDAGGKNLKVIENFFIKNDSQPQMTQYSQEPFDFYLPEGAIVDGSAALAPGGMPVQATPLPLAQKGKFTFLFPIRPGETRFQVSYHVAYPGRISLDPHVTSPTDAVAIMMPRSMKFEPANTNPYSAVNDEVNAQTYVARNVQPGQQLGFELSGTGELPRDTTTPDGSQAGAAAGAAGGGTVAATDNTAPGKGLDNPLDPEGNRDPWGKYKWWILAALALLLAGAAGVLLRKPAMAGVPAIAVPLDPQAQLLQTLKDEMFALETDRLQGKVGESEYTEQKTALELILRRALAKTAGSDT